MEKHQIQKRRRCNNDQHNMQTVMVNQSTTTDFDIKPMQLNAWTQTDVPDQKSISNLVEIELRDRVTRLEENLKQQSHVINELFSLIGNKENKNGFNIPGSSFKYKIVKEGSGEIQLEPVLVEFNGEEEVVYYEDSITQNEKNNENHENLGDVSTSCPYDKNDQLSHHQSSNDICLNSNTVNDIDMKSNITMLSNDNSIATASSPSSTSRLISCETYRFNEQYQEVSQSKDHLNSDVSQKNNEISKESFTTTNTTTQHESSIYPNGMFHTNFNANLLKNETTTEQNTSTYIPIVSKPKARKSKNNQENRMLTLQQQNSAEITLVSLGPNNTCIPIHVYEKIDWSSTASATRRLLTTVFDRITLATHSLTGKPSPAFHGREKPSKKQLDPNKVGDIIYIVTRMCNVAEREVRNAITTKCADENKMLRQRELKNKSLNEFNKENTISIINT